MELVDQVTVFMHLLFSVLFFSFPPGVWIGEFKLKCTASVPSIYSYFITIFPLRDSTQRDGEFQVRNSHYKLSDEKKKILNLLKQFKILEKPLNACFRHICFSLTIQVVV